MPHLTPLLASPRPCLVISLPRNDADLARAALDAGADALKIHAGVYHHATGMQFPPLPDALPQLEAVLAAVDGRVPVGIVPGLPETVTAAVLADLAGRGFAFTDAYAHQFSASALRGHGLEVWLAPEVEAGYTEAEVATLARLPGVDALEAVVVPHAEYGTGLTARDVAAYARLVQVVGETPLVLPTQRRLVPEDVVILHEVGITNIMLGAVVLGDGADRAAVAATMGAFRAAMDALQVPARA